MAGIFTITELQRSGNGAYVNAGRKFEWTADEHSVPRGTWKFGVEQRTVREDYPGSEEPVEQILGWNYKPFTLSGVWDDRYMGQGKALDTYEEFEALVQTGSMVRIEYNTISFKGIIKHVDFDYKRADYIGYEFEVSPHLLGGTGQRSAPKAGITSPMPFVYTVVEVINGLDVLTIPGSWLTLDNFLLLADAIKDLGNMAAALSTLTGDRLLYASEPFQAWQRIVSGFRQIRVAGRAILTTLSVFSADTHCIPTSGASVLTYEAWQRGLAHLLRLLILQCLEAEKELGRQALPETAALYRPYEGESLYAISNRFYGTPNQWRTIMEANGVETVTLTGTELLIIPRRVA